MTIEEGFLDIGGGKIFYKIYGAEVKATPLVVVHGGPGFTHEYMEPLNSLAIERPVIFYDQTDCGNSTKHNDPARWNIEYLGREFAEVCAMLGLTHCHALGHSIGSSIIISSLIEAGCSAIKSLILANPTLNGQMLHDDIGCAIELMPDEARRVLLAVRNNDTSKFTQEQFEQAQMVFLKRVYIRSEPWPECFYRSLGRQNIAIYNHSIGQSIFRITGNLRHYDITDKLGGITVPVLITWGAYEIVNPKVDTVAFINNKIPGARSVVFNESGHFPHLDESEAFNKAVSDFINENEMRGL
ncbi:MAG: proline iminopeptidase-family hydrolase [Candidatus Magnetominusculus sp. LBB02]|nr:proline iminopeptidase-family hydrolase [Candidatus Magnetominusculus sp. LBB02]